MDFFVLIDEYPFCVIMEVSQAPSKFKGGNEMTDDRLFQTPDAFRPVLRFAVCTDLHIKADGDDMWRGGVWLNYNYFLICGLRRYGYDALATSIKEKTLSAVNRWFEETGQIFEFYDPGDQTAPWRLNRKGPQPRVPDYRARYHAITDFNWSACFTLLLIQNCDLLPPDV